ncbi:hypothetical protein Q5762_18105 [Streptomyces sp. P9(2023)]|uniref:hypothetical protein n=1 Tax=Streptomyces sp. P9(2023) TaxID=3064394 RepID=UPI0028F449AA|nr:hypothetical protein [Streptomyces sp. P9(2023)]MDT9690219.1 hypothetical protein [Streptomyces sp. P9(2023)]
MLNAGQTGGPVDWAASGAVGPNAAYRNQTLQYGDVELNFDEAVEFQTIKQLWFQAFAASLFAFLLFGLLPSIFSGEFPDGMDTGLIVSIIVFWVVLLFARLTEPISEWKTLLEEKAAASSSAYATIYGALNRRRIPVSAVPARIRSDITPEVVHNRLVITSGRYVAYVTVFAYGTSLYVGWTMWRSRSGAVIIGHFIKDIIGGFLGRTGNVMQMLRTERARAMREAVHSATREGVEVAVQGIEVPLASTFGQEPPIRSSASAPPAPPVPPAHTPSAHTPSAHTPPGHTPSGYIPSGHTPPAPPSPHVPPQGPNAGGWNQR